MPMNNPRNVRMVPITVHLPTDLLEQVDQVIAEKRETEPTFNRGDAARAAISRWAKESRRTR